MEERAQILETGIPLFFKAQIEIKAPVKKIFDFISNPANHRLMDGSGMVKGVIKGPSKLYLGAKFGMKMRLGIPYVITNQVVEFKDNNLIAWQHLLRNVWRYELQEVDQNTTIVTETWDGRNALSRWWVDDSDQWVPKAMAKTLVKLKGICER